MTCVFCGNRATDFCPVCGRRTCDRHRRWRIAGAVCRDCRAKRAKRGGIAVGGAVVGGLALAVVAWLAAW